MKKVFLMAGLMLSLGLCTMAQTEPSTHKKETKKESTHKGDSTSKAGHEKKGGKKMTKKQ